MGDKNNNKKTRSYRDINKKYGFINNENTNGEVDGKRARQNKRPSRPSQPRRQPSRPSSPKRDERARRPKEENLDYTRILSPAMIEQERRRIERAKKEAKAKKIRRNRMIFGIGTLIVIILIVLLIKNILGGKKEVEETPKTPVEDVQEDVKDEEVGMLQKFSIATKTTDIYKDPKKKDEVESIGSVPTDGYVKNYGVNGDYTRIAYQDKVGYVKTADLEDAGKDNEFKVVEGMLIVNDEFTLPSDYNPGIDQEAQKAFDIMVATAKRDEIVIKSASDYRNYEQQSKLSGQSKNQYGEYNANTNKSVKAGASEHQTGLAFDIMGEDYDNKYDENFGTSKEAKWLEENAHKSGFILRYPKGKENITGRTYEPWHYRFVGVEIATEIHEKGITLEEFVRAGDSTGENNTQNNQNTTNKEEQNNTENKDLENQENQENNTNSQENNTNQNNQNNQNNSNTGNTGNNTGNSQTNKPNQNNNTGNTNTNNTQNSKPNQNNSNTGNTGNKQNTGTNQSNKSNKNNQNTSNTSGNTNVNNQQNTGNNQNSGNKNQ